MSVELLKKSAIQILINALNSAISAAESAASLIPSESIIVKQWITAESFDISNITYSKKENIESADLSWADGESGTISNLQEDSDGRITSLRFNRPDNKHITVSITYDGDDVDSTTLTATGY